MKQLSRREFLKTVTISSAALAARPGDVLKNISGRSKTPNLVYVFPDQFRAQAMGFMNQDPVITPNIDKFASESKVFTNAVSNWPLCSPYRGMLMTGRWPHSTGIITNCNSSQPDVYLRKSEITFTDVLSDVGYDVGYIGKWHLDTPQGVPKADRWQDAIWDCYPLPDRRHGINFWHGYNCSDNHLRPHYWIGDAKEDGKTFFDEYSPLHEAKVTSEFIINKDGKVRDSDKPFAIFVSMNPPHPPFDKVPDKYRKLYPSDPEVLINRKNVSQFKKYKFAQRNIRDYFAAVSGVDDAFGQILKAIDKAGLADDTVVVFSSDHGEMMGSHGRTGKTCPYEEAFRIPLIVRWPGRIPRGNDGLHINVPDYMPTLLGLMGLKDKIPSKVQGTNYSNAFLGRDIKKPGSTFYMRCSVNKPHSRGVRTDRYTFVVEKEDDNSFNYILFDNQNDPYQLKNIADESPELSDRLKAELNRWLKATNDPWGEV